MCEESTPFEKGYAAELAGLGFLDNPNEQDSVAFRRWVDGYVRSMQDRRGLPPYPQTAGG